MLKVATAFSGGFGSVEFALKYLEIPHEIVFACEWMKPQRESYILNHGEPTSNFYEDIRTLDGTKYKGEIDYYHLSPPCQSYSLAGSRGGATDERGGLMFEAIKSIDQVQPKMFSVENVKGLLSSNGGEDWKNIIRDFKSLKGYTISWGIMNAKEQGTPQNRERVFIVGFRGQAPQFSFPPRQEMKFTLKDLLDDVVDDKYFLNNSQIEKFSSSNFNQESSRLQEKDYCDALLKRDFKSPKLVQVGNIDQKGHNSLWGRVYNTNGIAPTQNAKGGGGGAKTGLFMVEPKKINFYVVPRGGNSGGWRELNVSPAITSSSLAYNNFINYKCLIRKLTPRECARVQGDFKDMFKFGKASDTKLYEFIGNAMDINTTKNLISRMLNHLKNNVNITVPGSSSFVKKENVVTNLFDIEVA